MYCMYKYVGLRGPPTGHHKLKRKKRKKTCHTRIILSVDPITPPKKAYLNAHHRLFNFEHANFTNHQIRNFDRFSSAFVCGGESKKKKKVCILRSSIRSIDIHLCTLHTHTHTHNMGLPHRAAPRSAIRVSLS